MLLIILVGVPGSGKSTLAKTLQGTVFSLDSYRTINGIYQPDSTKRVIPEYKKDVMSCQDPVIVLDNTHLKFEPDWQLAKYKCTQDQRDLLVLEIDTSEFSLFTNRSNHQLDDTSFFRSLTTYPGYRLGHLLNKRIPWRQVEGTLPHQIDPFVKVTTFPWENGILIVTGGYLGYLDQDMARTAIRAGHTMEENGVGHLFMQKEGALHMTLAIGKQPDLIKLAKHFQTLAKPKIVYRGIGKTDQVYYLVVDTIPWENIVHCDLHVTLGYESGDVHDVSKKDVIWDIGDDDTPFDHGVTDYTTFENKQFKNKLLELEPALTTFRVPQTALTKLNYLLTTPLVKSKWTRGLRNTWLLGFKVESGYMSDDDVYKDNPHLLDTVPRGLHYIFQIQKTTCVLLDTVFPTPKFFGDNDTDEGVDIQTILPEMKQLVVTEKANGEMFTMSVLCQKRDEWYIVLGSKNQKYLFFVRSGCSVLEFLTQLSFYHGSPVTKELLESPSVPLWMEMCHVFYKQVLSKDCSTLLDSLLSWTVSAEFESYLHPHLLKFPKGHQAFQFFAVSKASPQFANLPIPFQVSQSVLTHLSKFKLPVLTHTSYRGTLDDLRQATLYRKDCEGVVALELDKGIIKTRVKLKTLWYVIHRGFREKLKKIAADKAVIGVLNQDLLQSKLDIFGIDKSEEYSIYLDKLVSFVKKSKKPELAQLVRTNYPSLIAQVSSMKPEFI